VISPRVWLTHPEPRPWRSSVSVGNLAGALGAELCDRLFELGWVERRGSDRAAALTEAGSVELRELLELDLERTA
jgi:hypothetical protein